MKVTKQDIIEIKKLSNEKIKYVFNNGKSIEVSVIKLKSRASALRLLEQYTKIALKCPDAYENLHKYCNDWSRHRNYELEDNLEGLSHSLGYRIDEICPFNGFKWFS